MKTAAQNTPPPEVETLPSETITLEITRAHLPPQSQRTLSAHATLQHTTEGNLLAQLISKKLGGLFTVRAA